MRTKLEEVKEGKEVKEVKEIKINHLYDITYTHSGSVIWRSITLCTDIYRDGNKFLDIEIKESNSNPYKIMSWEDNHDLIDSIHYKVIALGDKEERPEYFL